MDNNESNVEVKKGFGIVCVWPGTELGDHTVEDFEAYIKNEFGVTIQFLEVIITGPDFPGSDSGGRSDLFFAVHNDDIMKFSVPRLAVGIRWIEDVLAEYNYIYDIYPKRVYDYLKIGEQA